MKRTVGVKGVTSQYCPGCKYNIRYHEGVTIQCVECGIDITDPKINQTTCGRKCLDRMLNKRRRDRNKELIPPAPPRGYAVIYDVNKARYVAHTPAYGGKKGKRFYGKTEEVAVDKRTEYLRQSPVLFLELFDIIRKYCMEDNTVEVLESALAYYVGMKNE